MLNEMKRELSFHSNIRFEYRQADGNSSKQVEQVRELLNKKLDLLIISPNEADPLTPIVEQAFNNGIPVIVVDRNISTSLFTTYVGGNNYEIGKMAGQYIAGLLNGSGRLVEITGLPTSTPAIDRHKGFMDALKNYPLLKVVKQVNGQWLKEIARKELETSNINQENADLVFAHNDMMALGAHEYFISKGNKIPRIIGIDGLAGAGAGMDLVSKNILTATMLYPTGGEEAIKIAVRILENEEVPKENLLQTTVIDSSNVRLMQLQTVKLNNQQKEIERQQEKMVEQQRIYNTQRTFVYILISSLVLAMILGGIAYYSLRENRKINKKLQLKNFEIIEQQQQLVQMSAKAQAANEAKVNFFTNISHEFRTPLTLILGPLEDMIANPKNVNAYIPYLNLIHKNVFRLLRMVNQLIDFRKIELDKMKLKASKTDIIQFISEIEKSYRTIALKRNIDLRLITTERELEAWIDVAMIDKVIFNLLSNAFKFSNDNGYVHIYINKNEDGKEVIIKIEDNGIGMSKDALEHAFEMFYQGEYENYKGSGLGLALSRELVLLHKGTITVSSEKWKGTSFTIRLPLGKDHFAEDELMENASYNSLLSEHAIIFTSELQETTPLPLETGKKGTLKEHTILLIEDNQELRQFLLNKLSGQYEMLEADNGQTAIQMAFDNIPDLIICDIVIPGKDGMELTSLFKSDIRTSHIPIIILTARTSIDQQIEGLKNKADAYITKPFNQQVLEQTIYNLVTNRNKLKEHFTADISSGLKTQSFNKQEKKFIHEFSSIIEANMDNENLSIEEICKQMGISRIQLYRKVKALLKMNVNDYILSVRLQKARYLLQHEPLSVSEIAYKVGFSSPAYFSTVFKNRFGTSPRAFKEK